MKLSDNDLGEMFDQFFDECFPEIVFGSLTYSPSSVFKSADAIAYNEELGNYIDRLLSDEEIYEDIDGNYFLNT